MAGVALPREPGRGLQGTKRNGPEGPFVTEVLLDQNLYWTPTDHKLMLSDAPLQSYL